MLRDDLMFLPVDDTQAERNKFQVIGGVGRGENGPVGQVCVAALFRTVRTFEACETSRRVRMPAVLKFAREKRNHTTGEGYHRRR